MSFLTRKCVQQVFQLQVRSLHSGFSVAGCCKSVVPLQSDDKCDGLQTYSRICRQRLHTSSVDYHIHDYKKNKSGNENRHDKKKTKAAYIKVGMTAKDLSRQTKVSEDECLTCLELVTEKTFEPDQGINDLDTLKKVCQMLEKSFVVVKDSKKSSAKIENILENKKETDTPADVDIVRQPQADIKCLVQRPPVVTIMGHVDHGKTTLLDALRESSIVDGEFGGITQHVGAFVVKLKSGHSITFLDTPGHQAFSAMRARGASVTDIVILVIAAEDGIMPQTIESIQHAKAAKVPLIVAINKIDKYKDSIETIKNMLASYDVVAEDYGGDVQVVPISALKRINLDQLEEAVITLAEYLELKADPGGMVEGSVIETRTDTGLGKMATILVQRGTLKKGAYLISGTTWTKVRALFDCNGQRIDEALPSTPVEVGGWKEFPVIGDDVLQAKNMKHLTKALDYRLEQARIEKDKDAQSVIDEKRKKEREVYMNKREEKLEYLKSKSYFGKVRTSIRDVELMMYKGYLPENEITEVSRPRFHLVIKGDVAGSVEAIVDTLATFRSDVCDIDILHTGVGDVTQHDIELAEMFQGVVYAFNVGVDINAQSMENEVPIKHHNVIYHLFNDLVDTINHQLPAVPEEEIIGKADILDIFVVTEKLGGKNRKKVPVAGCACTFGNLERKHLFKVVRGDEVIVKGDHLVSLKHHKDEVSNIVTQQECGIQFHIKGSEMFEVGDTVVCYKIVDKQLKLDWKPDFDTT